MVGELVADGARWLLAAVLVLAVLEKSASLWTRSAAWHPLMLVSPGRRRHAASLMVAALCCDIVAVGLLLAAPVVGSAVAAALVVAYSVLALPVHGRGGLGSCRCFWKMLNTSTRAGLLARNALLVACALVIAAYPPEALTLAGLAVGGCLLAVVAAMVAVADRPGAAQPSDVGVQ
jgi:hypothetical protein